jgi:hypothetical protein
MGWKSRILFLLGVILGAIFYGFGSSTYSDIFQQAGLPGFVEKNPGPASEVLADGADAKVDSPGFIEKKTRNIASNSEKVTPIPMPIVAQHVAATMPLDNKEASAESRVGTGSDEFADASVAKSVLAEPTVALATTCQPCPDCIDCKARAQLKAPIFSRELTFPIVKAIAKDLQIDWLPVAGASYYKVTVAAETGKKIRSFLTPGNKILLKDIPLASGRTRQEYLLSLNAFTHDDVEGLHSEHRKLVVVAPSELAPSSLISVRVED